MRQRNPETRVLGKFEPRLLVQFLGTKLVIIFCNYYLLGGAPHAPPENVSNLVIKMQ